MAIKPFAIQGSDLTLGGVNLQAGTTTIVIPGVTQATDYFVEEVDDRDGSNPSIFGSNANAVTVIDNADYVYRSGGAQSSGSYAAAGYSVDELNDGQIEEINVENQGIFLTADKNRAEAANMWATTTPTPFVSFNAANWTQIPFRPKMRAGGVENVGGGNADTGNFTFSDDTITNGDGLLLNTNRGTLAIGTNMEVPGVAGHFHIAFDDSNLNPPSSDLFLGDDYNYVKLPGSELNPTTQYGVEIGADDRDSGDQHVWRFNTDGDLYIPPGKTIRDAMTGDDLLAGGGSTTVGNVWIQDFETITGAPTDIIPSANSVEYLANGDIVALFSQYNDTAPGRYNSLARFSPTGTKIWSMKFSGALYTDGWGLAVDNANGFIYLAGKKSDDPGYDVATLTKLAQADGAIVWSKTYDVGYGNTNSVVDVSSDGNPVIVGYAGNGTDNQIVTTKISNVDGTVIWSKALNGQGDDQAYGMAIGASGQVVTVGYMDQVGIINAAATVYTVPASNPLWTVGGTFNLMSGVSGSFTFTDGVPTFTNIVDPVGGRTVDDIFVTLSGLGIGGAEPQDDMVVKIATLVPNDTDNRIVVAQYDSNGSLDWQKAVTIEVGYTCQGADADIDGDSNIYVCGNFGYDDSGTTRNAMIIIKFNSSGVKQWTRKVVGNCEDYATSIVVGPDNCLYLSAFTGTLDTSDYSMVVAKYNLDGTVVWQRLLDNTTTWTFAGSFFFGSGNGGSTIAVRSGYVAVGGGFADPGGITPHAIVAQFDSDGTVFTVGNYDFKAATFSGFLDSSASNITVFDAGKTPSDYIEEFTIGNFDPTFDLASDLVGTIYSSGIGANNELVSGAYSVTLNADGSITFPTKTTVDYANRTSYTTGPTLELAKDPTESSVVITGPAATFSEPYAKRLVIQGQPGWRGSNTGETGAEGGDVYIWAGYGGEGSNYTGDGGDVKLRGGHGGQSAGYVRIEAGEAVNANGEGGFVDINAGDATAWFGGAETSHGGNVEIRGGRGYAYGGNVNIHTASTTAHNQTWTFSHDGSLTLPAGGNLIIPNGLTISDNVIEGNVVATVGGQWTYATNADGGTDNQGSQGVNLAVTTETSAMLVSWQDNHTIPWTMQFYGEGTVEVVGITDYSSYIQVATSVATSHLLPVVVTSGNYQSGTPAEVVLKVDTKLWIFGTDGNLIIPATGDIIRDGTSIFASSTALPIVTITNANYNQFDQPVAPATETTDGAVSFTVTSPVALTATGLLLISGSNNKGGTIVAGSTSTGSQTLAFDMGGYSSTYTVMAFATTTNGTSYSAPVGGNGGYVCFPAGTMITLRNGDKKAIEYIGYSDDLLVWNFDLGVYASAKPIWIMAAETASEYNLLTFSNGFVLKTVGNHHIFNKQAERFTHTMTADTPIGTVSINEQGEEITLVSAEVVRETVEFYNVWTEYHLNMFAEGVLTSNRFNNTYPMISMKFVKGNKELRPLEEFNGIDPKWIHGLRLQEQTAEHTAEYIKWYVSERLEKLSIDSTEMVE